MVGYIVKRLLQSALTVLIIVSIVFVLMRMMPTDYFFTEDELMKLSEEIKQEKLQAAGLLDPIPQQLVRFYGGLLRGDLGTSRRIQSGVPVVEVIGGKFAVSLKLGAISLGIAYVLGIIMGVFQARFKDGIFDNIGMAYTVFVNAVPPLIVYSLILVFGSRVFGLPSMYSVRNAGISSILPVTCLSLGSIAGVAVWVRRYMVDELTKDYIKLAKIKGLSTRAIMFRHVLKNAFVPYTQYIPMSFLLTIGGSFLVERFFSIPGMGTLMVDAIGRYDTNIVQGAVILYASLGVLGMLIGDVLMSLADPRIRLTGKEATR